MRVPRIPRRARLQTIRRSTRVVARSGFSVIEVIVACVVLVTGVLGLQAAATVIVRQAEDARTQALSAEVAAARFERLVHGSCAQAANGIERVRGVESEWRTSILPDVGGGLSSQTIRFVRRSGPLTDTYLGAYRCR